MSQKLNSAIAVIGIDIGKNSFHIVGHDKSGTIVLQRNSRPEPAAFDHYARIGLRWFGRRIRFRSA